MLKNKAKKKKKSEKKWCASTAFYAKYFSFMYKIFITFARGSLSLSPTETRGRKQNFFTKMPRQWIYSTYFRRRIIAFITISIANSYNIYFTLVLNALALRYLVGFSCF